MYICKYGVCTIPYSVVHIHMYISYPHVHTYHMYISYPHVHIICTVLERLKIRHQSPNFGVCMYYVIECHGSLSTYRTHTSLPSVEKGDVELRITYPYIHPYQQPELLYVC